MEFSECQMQTLLEPIRRVRGTTDFAQASAASFGQIFSASKAVFIERQSGSAAAISRSPDDVHFVNWPSWCKPHYCAHFRDRDPIGRWLASAEARRDVSVACLSDLVPAQRLVRAPYYTDMMRPGGARHVMTLVVRNGDAVAGALSLVRDAASDDFSGDERALARTIAPVLGLAYAIAAERQAHARMPRSIDGIDALTPRERQVMGLVVQGHSNKVIARLLDASPWTIKNHLRAIFEKMQVANRTALCARVGGGFGPPADHRGG